MSLMSSLTALGNNEDDTIRVRRDVIRVFYVDNLHHDGPCYPLSGMKKMRCVFSASYTSVIPC